MQAKVFFRCDQKLVKALDAMAKKKSRQWKVNVNRSSLIRIYLDEGLDRDKAQ